MEFVAYGREERGGVRTGVGAIVSAAERAGRTTLLLVRIPYAASPNGLPVPGELRRVSEIEDRVTAALAPHDALYVGHLTTGGRTTVAYYTGREAPASVRVKAGLFKTAEFRIETRIDPEWTWFDGELAPTPEEREFHRNLHLYHALGQQCDVPAKPRDVDFTLLFPTPDDRAAFLGLVEGEGYAPNDEGLWTTDPPEPAYAVTLVRRVSIEPDEMARRCARLREQAARHGGEFDGWGCPVET